MAAPEQLTLEAASVGVAKTEQKTGLHQLYLSPSPLASLPRSLKARSPRGGATTEAAALRAPNARQEETQGGGQRDDDREEPPARKRARAAAAGTGAPPLPPPNREEVSAAALFAVLDSSSSSGTFPAPSSSTSSEDGEDDDGRGESGGGDGAGYDAAAAAGGGGGGGRAGGERDDGFVFASQPVTMTTLKARKVNFNSHVLRALRLNGGAPDSVQRGTGDAACTKESYRFAVFALRSAPARRRGSSSWEPPARGVPGTQAFDSEVVSFIYPSNVGVIHELARVAHCFRRRGERGIETAEQEGALRDAAIGDELVFARKGMDRELYIWLKKKKKTQGCNEGDERGDDIEEPPARKHARVAAGTGARAAAAGAAAAATAAPRSSNEAAPRDAALFSSPSPSSSSSSETFPAPSSSTSSGYDDDGGESGGGGDGAGDAAAAAAAAAAARGGGQDDGFVFASQPVTRHMLSTRGIEFHSSVMRALRVSGGAPDPVQRGGSKRRSTRFAVFALRSAPARRGSSSWEPPIRGAPGTQAFDSDVVSCTYHSDRRGIQVRQWLARVARCFRRRGEEEGVATAEQEGALRDAEVGDELVFARRGTDRELFLWLVKKMQGLHEGDERGDDIEEPPARERARLAAGTGARAAAAAAVAAAAPRSSKEAAPRAAALFSSPSPSLSSETFPAPSSTTSSGDFDDDDDDGESGGGDGAGEGATGRGGGGRGGGGRDEGFVFASQPVTKFMLQQRKIEFNSNLVRALRLNEGAPDSVQRGTGGAETGTEFYRFAVFALRSAPARRGSSSWEPPIRGAPGTQAFDSDVAAYTHVRRNGRIKVTHKLARASRRFRRHGDRHVMIAAQEGALRDAEVGDELVFARRGLDRELFLWLVKKRRG